MNVTARQAATMTRAEFDLFMLRHEGPKCEFVGGKVVQQSQTTKTHARIVAGFMRAFFARLDPTIWSITADTIADDRVQLPDLLVERLDADGPPMRALAPVVLVEVMSPSSAKTDFHDQPREFVGLPTLHAYVVASQDECACWVRSRAQVGEPFPADPVEVRIGQSSAEVAIAGLALTLPLSEVDLGTGLTT